MSPDSASEFDDHMVIVSGASSGIGRAVANELARRGACLVLLGRNRATLQETADEAGASRSILVELDLADHSAIMPAIRGVVREHGRVYGLCHSAGTVQTLALSATGPANFQSMLDVNYLAGMELARSVTRRDVMEENGGALVFLSSISSRIGAPGQIAYSGSKGAVVAAARSMAMELARRKIRVNAVSPGMVRTPMTAQTLSKLSEEQIAILEAEHPLGFGRPEDVASAVVFLLSPVQRWITGTELVVDGGLSAH